MNANDPLRLPLKTTGRPSKAWQANHSAELSDFADKIKRIGAEIGNKVSSRGWCYLLEGMRLINKDQFDIAEDVINECRYKGVIPMDFVASDQSRSFSYVENLNPRSVDPKEYLARQIRSLLDSPNYKEDVAFWKSQGVFIQMMVEKIDLRELFKPICSKYHVPIGNAKGWSDMLSRWQLALRFKEAEELGLKVVLLYYGDHDPAGLLISETLRKNLDDISEASKWTPKNLIIDRFGLNHDFIMKYGLVWIDNLISGSGKPPDKNKAYVREYVKKFGERKVEANAILRIRDISCKYCEDTILKYMKPNPFDEYKKAVTEKQEEVRKLMDTMGIIKTGNQWLEALESTANNPVIEAETASVVEPEPIDDEAFVEVIYTTRYGCPRCGKKWKEEEKRIEPPGAFESKNRDINGKRPDDARFDAERQVYIYKDGHEENGFLGKPCPECKRKAKREESKDDDGIIMISKDENDDDHISHLLEDDADGMGWE